MHVDLRRITQQKKSMALLERLPDLVIYDILTRLPSKLACQVSFVSKQWQAAISSALDVNLDQEDDLVRHRHSIHSLSDYIDQHNKFFNFLKGYLKKHLENTKLIDKLRLHSRMLTDEDAATIDRWLEAAIEGDVKELDINSLQYRDQMVNRCYCLPWETVVKAKSLTSLNLKFVDVPCLYSYYNFLIPHRGVLASLKTMSFTAVRLRASSFFSLLFETSSIEYLSLTGCYVDPEWGVCEVWSNFSVKCLEVKYCHGIKDINVVEAMSLESLTVAYNYTRRLEVMVDDAPNLKKIDICVDEHCRIRTLQMWQCHRAVEATINTQYLGHFEFFGSLEAQVSVKACWKSIIWVTELWEEEWFLSNPENLFALIEFLQGFGCCRKVWLCVRDSKALIIPESFRKTIGTFPTPLPESCTLNVAMPSPPKPSSRDYWDLQDSINWIAHSAKIVKQNPQWLIHFMERGRKRANKA